MWKAKLLSVQENSNPNDSINIVIEYSDGERVIGKTYNLQSGNIKDIEDVKDIARVELQNLEQFDLVKEVLKELEGKELA